MLAAELEAAVQRGAPAGLFEKEVAFHRSSPHGTLHGSTSCPRLQGAQTQTVLRRPSDVRRSCDCGWRALAGHGPAMLAHVDWRTLEDLEGEVAEAERVEDASSTGLRLVRLWDLRNRIENELEDHDGDWRRTWGEALLERTRAALETVEEPLRTPDRRASRDRALVAELHMTEERHSFLALEDSTHLGSGEHAREVSRALHQRLVEGLHAGADEAETTSRLAGTIRANRPEVLDTRMLEYIPTSAPRPGQSVAAWVEETWAAESSAVAGRAYRAQLGRIDERLAGSGRTLLALHPRVRHDETVSEVVATYRVAEVQDVTLLVLPTAAAEGLERSRWQWATRSTVLSRAELEEGDTPEVLEVLTGLYEPDGTTFRRVGAALEAARGALAQHQ